MFPDEIECTEAHGFDDGLGGAERAHEDDDGVRIPVTDLREEVHPAEGFDVCFGDDDIRLVLDEQLVGFFGV